LPQDGRFVQHLGAWLMLAMLWTTGLYGRVEKERTCEEREGRQPRASTVRVALDALIVALALGQRCIEGVRRLQTSTAAKLLRASAAPTASWVRRVLGLLAAQGGATHIALATAGAHVRAAQAATGVENPIVFYFDNHVRPYTGKHVGQTRRPQGLADAGPFAKLPKRAFTEKLAFAKNDVVHWCEAPDKNLGSSRGPVRRIAVRDHDGHPINLIAISDAPAEWLIGVMRGRWRQENGFKHGVERWGQNQLDSRSVHPCDPETTIPNPARRRLDRDLRLARTREGEARRRLALLAEDAPGRAAHERDLEQARATQAKLVALRADVPTHARLDETDLAHRLVSHCPDFKLLVDAVRAACYNAETELAARLAPHMKRPDEAKKLLANVFASPGEVRVYATGITVALDCAANAAERDAIAALLSEITATKLTLPGDPVSVP
jgi:hypothetical protein